MDRHAKNWSQLLGDRVKQFVKRLFLPEGRFFRCIKFGLARGIKMNLDLQSQSQRYLGLEERELAKYFNHCVPRCRSAVDIGANDGYYTLIFLRSSAERII